MSLVSLVGLRLVSWGDEFGECMCGGGAGLFGEKWRDGTVFGVAMV